MAEKKVANGVIALSSAAVLAIYGAGYARTREAADRFAQQAAERRPHIPAPRDERPAPLPLGAPAAPVTVPENPSTPPSEAPPPTQLETPTTGAAASSASPRRDSSVPPAAETRTTASNAVISAVKDVSPAPGAPTASVAPPVSSAAQASSVLPTPAPPPPAAPSAPAAPAATPQTAGYKDGTYYGWGTCRHGDIQAAVVIQDGKITEARVERCETRYSCNWITPIPPRILAKQSTTYDYVSGATESSDAFQDAVSEALSQAK